MPIGLHHPQDRQRLLHLRLPLRDLGLLHHIQSGTGIQPRHIHIVEHVYY
jgi:hypothetical protein